MAGLPGGGNNLRDGVLLLADSQEWEADALAHLRASRAFVVARRCLDIPDLMAMSGTGEARLALVAGDASGFDASCVAHLARSGVAVVAVVPAGVPAVGSWTPPRGTAEVVDGGLASLEHALLGARDALGDGGSPHAPAPAEEVADGAAASRADPGPPAGADLRAEGTEVVSRTPGRRGTVLCVWGPIGSPGRTTVALALAGELASRGRRTTLLDVDPWGGTAGQHLGVLSEVSGLLAASRATSAGSLTSDRLADLCVSVGRHLRVLTGLPGGDRWSEVGAGTVEDLFERARGLGDVLVDAGSGLDATALGGWSGRPPREHLATEAVVAADLVMLVAAPDPVGLTRLVRGAAELAEVRPGGPDLVVLNRIRPTLGWRAEEVMDLVRRTVPDALVVTLPDDRAGVDRAMAEGALLTESGPGPLRATVRDLVEDHLLPLLDAQEQTQQEIGARDLGDWRARLSRRRAAADRRR